MKPSAILNEAPLTRLRETLGAILDDLDRRITPPETKTQYFRVGIECSQEERDFLNEIKGGIWVDDTYTFQTKDGVTYYLRASSFNTNIRKML